MRAAIESMNAARFVHDILERCGWPPGSEGNPFYGFVAEAAHGPGMSQMSLDVGIPCRRVFSHKGSILWLGAQLDFAAIAFRFVLGSVFLLAGLGKLPRRSQFSDVVQSYGLLPGSLVNPVARLLPLVEIVFGGLLLLGLATHVVAGLSALALFAFSIAVGVNLARGRELDCGCFAVGAPRTITWVVLVRNAVLIATAVVVAATRASSTLGLDGVVSSGNAGAVSDGDALALLFAGTLAVLAMSLFDATTRARIRTAASGVRPTGVPTACISCRVVPASSGQIVIRR